MSPKRKVETPKDVAKRLREEGWAARPGKGDHTVFSRSDMPTIVTLDMGKREIPIGTLRSIYRAAGWKW